MPYEIESALIDGVNVDKSALRAYHAKRELALVLTGTLGDAGYTGCARLDAGFEIQGDSDPDGGPGLSIYNTDPLGTPSGETFIAFSADSDAGNTFKLASTSVKHIDSTDDDGYGCYRINITERTGGVGFDNMCFIGFGGRGARFFSTSLTPPGGSILDINGALTVLTEVRVGGQADAGDSMIQAIAVEGGFNAALMKNVSSATATMSVWNAATSGDNVFIGFYTETGATLRAFIDYNRAGQVARYQTSSNRDQKNIFGDASLETSCAILSDTRIREFAWKDDPTQKRQIGVVAQEVYESGFKGAVSTEHWTVDKTAWAFHLIAGWQDHDRRLAALEAR